VNDAVQTVKKVVEKNQSHNKHWSLSCCGMNIEEVEELSINVVD